MVLRVLGLVVSIGLADSMNPSTIAPALYLATGKAPLAELTKFTLGVAGAGFLGGEVTPLFFIGATLGAVLTPPVAPRTWPKRP